MSFSMPKVLARLLLPWLAAAGFETPPVLDASDIVAADLVKGERYELEAEVTNDGYMNSFVIDSDFGEFDAYGERLLRMRVHEVKALGQLDDLSKSEVFVKAVGEGAIRSLKGFQQIVTNPVQTAKGLPQGAGRFFKRTKHHAKAGYDSAKDLVTDDDEEEDSGDGEAAAGETEKDQSEKDQGFTTEAKDATSDYAKKYFGVNSAQRRWAQKLEVDPYTSNTVLQGALADVAKVDAAGRFATRLAPIPRVPGAKYANTVTSLVWSREPWELVEENSKLLLDAGASQERIQGFFDNVSFSPTMQTAFVGAMLELRGAQRLSLALEQAQTAESEAEARFFVHGALMLRWFHAKQSPIKALVDGGQRVFIARAEDSRLLIMLPVDRLFWTEEMAEAAARVSQEVGDDGDREIWLAGGISDRARSGFEELGWGVHPEMARAMKADPIEPPSEE